MQVSIHFTLALLSKQGRQRERERLQSRAAQVLVHECSCFTSDAVPFSPFECIVAFSLHSLSLLRQATIEGSDINLIRMIVIISPRLLLHSLTCSFNLLCTHAHTHTVLLFISSSGSGRTVEVQRACLAVLIQYSEQVLTIWCRHSFAPYLLLMQAFDKSIW